MIPRMTPLLKRLLTSILWTAAFTLLIAGSLMGFGERLPYFAWSITLSFLACVMSGYLIVEHVIDRHAQETSRRVANAVGVALGEHLSGRREDRGRHVTPIR